MPITIAFWNINTGEGSFDDRIRTFQNWCGTILPLPDLLLLEEVSHTLGPSLPGLTNMSVICFANTLDKHSNKSTKQLWALQSANAINQWNFQGRALELSELKSKRMLLKITMKIRAPGFDKFALWSIHANASATGGRTAVRAVEGYLEKNPDAVVGGDFNCPIESAGDRATAPISWENNDLNFTQWNKVDGDTRGPNALLHLVTAPPLGTVVYKKIVPHNVIDYVMLGRSRVALPLLNCVDENTWKDILVFFDHCPVVYSLS